MDLTRSATSLFRAGPIGASKGKDPRGVFREKLYKVIGGPPLLMQIQRPNCIFESPCSQTIPSLFQHSLACCVTTVHKLPVIPTSKLDFPIRN